MYEGEFREGKQEGLGKVQYTNGRVYEGHWMQDRAHGDGRMTFPSGEVRWLQLFLSANYRNQYISCSAVMIAWYRDYWIIASLNY